VGQLLKGEGWSPLYFNSSAACMATRWSEAIALKPVTAKAVAEAALEIFSRIYLPYQIMIDKGPQFVGSYGQASDKYARH